MDFTNFKQAIQKHFHEMQQGVDHLYEVALDKDELWNLYLDSFPAGTNEVFRVRREYDCGCCKQFIRAIGNVVTIKDDVVHTIWELQDLGPTFQPVADALDAYVKAHEVTDVYISKLAKIGTNKNCELLPDGTVLTWDHFYLELPPRLVNHQVKTIGDIQASFRDSKHVFKRSLDEITDEAVDTLLELIAQGSLYKGNEWETALKQFKGYKQMYANTPEELRDNFAWSMFSEAKRVNRIRNTSIGTLLTDVSEGMDLDEAVRKYEKITAPENYKRPKPIYSKRMLEDAKKTVTELGYSDSLSRRFATVNDITVNNLLFCNRDVRRRVQQSDIFDAMAQDVMIDPKKFSRVQEIGIKDFIANVLPTATSIEAILENRHAANMVSLIAPVNKDAKSMFKWSNGFGWSYAGNITDSSIRENVKMAGGKVDGVLRFSIQWNDDEADCNDLDAHCVTPFRNHIFYANRIDPFTRGWLDIDIRYPETGRPAVENIAFPTSARLSEGKYSFYVNCYAYRGGKSGFKAEIETAGGDIYSFQYSKPLRQDESIMVAEVTYDKLKGFSVKEMLPAGVANRDIWGLQTYQFIPVSAIMYSPNYWDEQSGNGHRHYFFMLKDCINPEQPNGFYNEFLKPELEKHRRVFEALGSKAAVESTDDQLSGLGFSESKRNSLLVRVKGTTERVLKVIF